MVLSQSLVYLWHHHHVSIVPLHFGHISIIFPPPTPLQLHFYCFPSTTTSTTTFLLISHHRHNHQICIVFPPLPPPPPPSRPHFRRFHRQAKNSFPLVFFHQYYHHFPIFSTTTSFLSYLVSYFLSLGRHYDCKFSKYTLDSYWSAFPLLFAIFLFPLISLTNIAMISLQQALKSSALFI